jgi:hypothetical protein
MCPSPIRSTRRSSPAGAFFCSAFVVALALSIAALPCLRDVLKAKPLNGPAVQIKQRPICFAGAPFNQKGEKRPRRCNESFYANSFRPQRWIDAHAGD